MHFDLVDTAAHLGDQNANFWSMNRHLKSNVQNTNTFILRKLLHQFRQILPNDKDHHVFFIGDPTTCPANPIPNGMVSS